LKLVQKSQTRSESPTRKFVKFALLSTPLGYRLEWYSVGTDVHFWICGSPIWNRF